MSMQVLRESPGEVRLLITDAFDMAAAERVRAALGDLCHGSAVVLDFHEVRLFHASALESVARELSTEGEARVCMTGLPERQRRLLRYLGFSSALERR